MLLPDSSRSGYPRIYAFSLLTCFFLLFTTLYSLKDALHLQGHAYALFPSSFSLHAGQILSRELIV